MTNKTRPSIFYENEWHTVHSLLEHPHCKVSKSTLTRNLGLMNDHLAKKATPADVKKGLLLTNKQVKVCMYPMAKKYFEQENFDVDIVMLKIKAKKAKRAPFGKVVPRHRLELDKIDWKFLEFVKSMRTSVTIGVRV